MDHNSKPIARQLQMPFLYEMRAERRMQFLSYHYFDLLDVREKEVQQMELLKQK